MEMYSSRIQNSSWNAPVSRFSMNIIFKVIWNARAKGNKYEWNIPVELY